MLLTKNNMKRHTTSILFVILVSLLITACGGSSDKKILPPDPLEAGKATLEGIDSDNDNVRDDIQRWIALENDDIPEETKEKFTALTKTYIDLMVNPDSDSDTKSRFIKENYCLEKALNDKDKYFRYLSELANTKERIIQKHRIIYKDFDFKTPLKDIQCD